MPLNDIEMVACHAIKLLKNDEMHRQFKEQAILTVKEKFHSSQIVSEYEELYWKVAKQHVENQ